MRERSLRQASPGQQGIGPPGASEQREGGAADVGPWHVAAALVGGGAVFAGLAVTMGYFYLRTYLSDLGIPERAVTFAPHEYALASSPLFLSAAFFTAVTGVEAFSRRYAARPALVLPRAHGRRGRPLVAAATGLAAMVFFSTLWVSFALSDQVLTRLAPTALGALLATLFISFAAVALGLPTVAASSPRHGLGLGVVLAFSLIATMPASIGHIDARLTLETNQGTEKATLLLVPGAEAEGPWPTVEDGRIENVRVILVRDDYVYLLYRGLADGGPPTVHAIPAALVSRIDFFPGR